MGRFTTAAALILAPPAGVALAYGLHWSASNHGPIGVLLFAGACVLLLGLSLVID